MKVALLFPGQGSQKVGMGKDLADKFEVARETWAEADEALGFALSKLCWEGPEEQLRLTANTQPAILTNSIGALRALEKTHALDIAAAAGHSLGEYSALVAAGALRFRDAVKAVRERGRLMQEATPPGVGAMAALIGLEPAQVTEVCEECSTVSELVVPANLNAPGQIVVAGHAAAVRRAIESAKHRGGKMSVELNVSAPFHCPLMQPARDGMAPLLRGLEIGPLRFGVLANVTASLNRDQSRVVPFLLEQITAPVRWQESMAALPASGAQAAIEVGAGRVLAGLMRRIERNFKVHAMEDVASLEALAPVLGP